MNQFNFSLNRLESKIHIKFESNFQLCSLLHFRNKFLAHIQAKEATDYALEIDCASLTIKAPAQSSFFYELTSFFVASGFNQLKWIVSHTTDQEAMAFIHSTQHSSIELRVV